MIHPRSPLIYLPRNVLAGHWAEMLSVEAQQVNGRGVREYLNGLLAIKRVGVEKVPAISRQR